MINFGVDPVHFGMIMMLNLGIGLCHPPVGAILFVGCAVGKVTIEQVMRTIWPFYGVMFVVLMLVTYIPALSLWLPSVVINRSAQKNAPQKRRDKSAGGSTEKASESVEIGRGR